MTPIVVPKLVSARSERTHRPGAAIREAIALLWSAGAADPVREPAGLQYPMSARARRLMRSGRINGW